MLLKIIRSILIIIPIFILGWLISKDFVFGGELVANYDFKKDSSFIQPLWPPKKLSDISQDETGNYYQSIKYDPVFLAVDLPRPSFYEAILKIRYQKSEEIVFRVGLKDITKEWQFQLKDFEEVIEDGDWQIGTVSFSLYDNYIEEITRSKYDKPYRLNFLLSSPYLDETGQEIEISEIDIILKRDPVTWRNFGNKVRNFLSRKF